MVGVSNNVVPALTYLPPSSLFWVQTETTIPPGRIFQNPLGHCQSGGLEKILPSPK